MTRLAGDSRQLGRVAVVLGLLFAAGVTLRGTLPVRHPPRDPAADNPGSLTGVIALLSVSLLVIAIALFRRDRLPPRPPARELPDRRRGSRGGWNLRLGLIALGLLIAWLAAVIVLHRLGLEPGPRRLPTPAVVPDADVPAPGTRAPKASAPHGDTLRILMAATAVLVVMTVAATVLTALRRPRADIAGLADLPEAGGPEQPEPLALAAQQGLAMVRDSRLPPRQAIIACYAAMERALACDPDAAPQAADTPSEVLARAVGNRSLRPGSAAELVALFTEARFSRHVMTEEHRGAAQKALRTVLDELSSNSRSPV